MACADTLARLEKSWWPTRRRCSASPRDRGGEGWHDQTQHESAAGQSGAARRDYVTSPVHAQGEDLDQIDARSGDLVLRALDLGCGGGHVSYRVARTCARPVACDLTAATLRQWRRRRRRGDFAEHSTRQSAAESLPFADGEFDIVLCRFTAHHWHNFEAGLRQARRVLKAGGRAVFVDTVSPADAVLDSHLQAVELSRRLACAQLPGRRVGGRAGPCRFPRRGADAPPPAHGFFILDRPHPDAGAAAEAIRSLQTEAAAEVRAHFAVADDGSFDLRSVTFLLRAV